MTALRLLHLDDHLVAVDKPPGMLVHRTRLADGNDFLLQRLRRQLGRRVYAVHRLDRPTSGVLVFGLTPDAARQLSGQFERQTVTKRYLAVVRGWPEPAGSIDYPLADPEATAPARRAPRHALTDYLRLAAVELPVAVGRYPSSRYALVLVRPHTGRRHQIRRHFAHIRHPLIGDTTHGEGRHNRFFRAHLGLQRLLLHAWSLALMHPVTGAPLCIEARPDADWGGLLAAFGWERALDRGGCACRGVRAAGRAG
ncbi:MAG: pseudouridylate synthase [Thiohalocapsa sp.]|jgi:tRNA pseudouridine65 synthase|uniref:pseudouridine synthase n=1 Tax=Thiohalocapsa sp. TaxID=2497641 RepID=UPI0025D92859|nr:pseudouridine synthase [Thiohalocapsa sp.]MCG6939929.1 pseudouridylate synthase [Thiohalocapsa sp.]